MATQIETTEREIVLVEDAHIRPMMGLDILESLPSRHIPYPLVDPYILVHEGVVPITPEWASMDTKHPHRGFDNLWYLVAGSASTGHSTGPGGTMERARLETGSLLKLRTGRGVYHAEGIGEDELREGKAGSEMRGVLFWVNLARKDKGAEPTAQILQPQDVPVRHEGDAIVRVLVGEGSPVELGTPGLILDVELPKGGSFNSLIRAAFNGFVYMLEGEASFGANTRRAHRSQIAVLGPGRALTVIDAQPGTRFLLMPGSRTVRLLYTTDRTSTECCAVAGADASPPGEDVRIAAQCPRDDTLGRMIDGGTDPDRSRGTAERRGLRRLSGIRRLVVPPSSLRPLRPRRLLRHVALPARQSARGCFWTSGRPELRARRRLVLGLRERTLLSRPRPGPAAPSPARSTSAGSKGSRAPRLGEAVALIRTE